MPEQARVPEVVASNVQNNLPSIVYSPPASPQQDPEPEAPGVPLTHYLWILRRHRWRIVAFVATCILVTGIVSARLKPIYESTATVDINRQAPAEVIGQETTRSAADDTEAFLVTQIKLIQSDSVLRPVAERFHLLELEGQTKGSNSERIQSIAAAPVSLSRLKVSRPVGTNLLLISYRATDPRLAAEVSNAIANSYLAHTYNIQIRSSASLSSFMEKQLDQLKAKMEQSSQSLAQFEKDLDVINPEEKTNILSARLLQLNTDYTNAQAERVAKEAAWDAIKSGSIEAAQVSSQGEALAKLSDSLNQAREHFALIKATYGANHPEYRKAASQLAEVERQFEDTRTNIAERIAVEYRQALNREQMLQKTVVDTKAEWDRLSSRSFEYQQLKREADADKSLYDELIRKIRESDINAGFQNNNISIADAARPAAHPVFPNIRINLLLALLTSTVLAIGAALLLDSLDTTLRDPQEASRFLGVEVIGTMPVDRSAAQLPKPKAPMQADGIVAKVVPARNRGGYYRTTTDFEESIRTIRNTILLSDFEGRIRSIALTSAAPSEGKTTMAAHLAIANASRGKKTLLVDGDLRRPSLHARFGFSPQEGLSNVLTGELPWQDVVLSIDANPNLTLLPAGPGSHRAADLIGPRLSSLLDEFAKEYDLVLLDAPPLLGFAECLQMATAADGVLIVTRAGDTRRKAVAGVVLQLLRIRANIIGVVLNQVNQNTSSDGYSYYGYYKYGQERYAQKAKAE